ncbi:hypothetical protein X777_02556 [Ooceraea biroi]|uniref:Uncharacterized protein n=1 Tax=Ooceraea biroi TaxID=2015173 RepID=A0A026WMP7_OOCBI|nr:hypothetical protein X777_02556 [Ooceraea biroi]
MLLFHCTVVSSLLPSSVSIVSVCKTTRCALIHLGANVMKGPSAELCGIAYLQNTY